MTDPQFADATYIEPVTPDVVAKIIKRERLTRSCPPWAARRVERGRGCCPQGILKNTRLK